MNTLIENYRGFDIIFNSDNERFSFSLDEGNYTEKQSYAACKKNIDTYLKDNLNFEPFFCRHTLSNEIIEIVGIRKDGGFTFINTDGAKSKLRSYCESDYILLEKDDDIISINIKNMKNEIIKIESDIRDQIKLLKGVSLESIKSKYTQNQ